MTTLPFYVDLPMGFNFDGEVRGYVSTDDGTSHSYFKVMAICHLGQWYGLSSLRTRFERDAFDLIADQAAQHEKILPEAMRIEAENADDAEHEFRAAAE